MRQLERLFATTKLSLREPSHNVALKEVNKNTSGNISNTVSEKALILPIFLCGCKASSHTLKSEQILKYCSRTGR